MGHEHISTTQRYTHLSNHYIEDSLSRYWGQSSLIGDDFYVEYYQSAEQLPCNLNAEQVAAYLGFSRSQAYTLMHAEGFPTIRIGKRMLVSREKFLEWLENHTAKEE